MGGAAFFDCHVEWLLLEAQPFCKLFDKRVR